MAKLLILFICGFLPAALSQCNVQRAQPLLKRSAYDFAVRLTTRIAQEKENHFVASTFSVWALLATASMGAGGTTLEEFRKVLLLHKQPCFNDRYFELVKAIASDAEVTVERSSTIFVADGLQILDDFQQKVKQAGVSELAVLSFEDPDAVAANVSDYVSRATHNTITDLVTPGDLDNVYLIVIDALYFKGLWQMPFPYENTEIVPFYDDDGALSGEVNMMKVVGMFNMSTIHLINATAVALPFGAEGRYAMLIFLPQRGTALSAVIDSLATISLATIYRIFATDDMLTASVQIPKFQISSDQDNLKELLSDMGLRMPFDSYAAEFPYLSDQALYISNVVQKARVEVTEAGAEASAASAGFFAFRSEPEEFKADKPFFYMIVDTHTELPLFTGAYSKPSVR